jgi:hypothetical protein
MRGQTASDRVAAMAAMLKPDGARYSVHAAKISGRATVAAAARAT